MRVESSIHENIELCEELESARVTKASLRPTAQFSHLFYNCCTAAIDTCDGNNNCGVDS